MPRLKYSKRRFLRKFEKDAPGEKRIEFQRLTSKYSRRSLVWLIIMTVMVAYMIYYLSKA